MSNFRQKLGAKIGVIEPVPVNAPVHSVWCTCPLCVEWVRKASQPKP